MAVQFLASVIDASEHTMSHMIHDPEMDGAPVAGAAGETDAASVVITDRCTPEFLETLTPSPGIGAFSRYAPQAADRQQASLVTVAALPYGRVLVAHQNRLLVAYLTFHAPEGDCRWAALSWGKILELGGIEVARGFRHMGVSRRLLSKAFDSPDFDGVIVYAQALTWCWDLEGSGMSMAEYREMMLRLFAGYGFKRYTTDEPNICYHRANVLLARLGPKAPEALVKAFLSVLMTDGKGDSNR